MGTENRALVGDALELVVVGVGPYLDRVIDDAAYALHRDGSDAGGSGVVDRDLVSMLGLLALPTDAVADEASANAVLRLIVSPPWGSGDRLAGRITGSHRRERPHP